MLLAQVANMFGGTLAAVDLPGCRETRVREAHALGFAQEISGNRLWRMLLDLLLHLGNPFELVEEPGIDAGDAREFFYGMSLAERIAEINQPLRMRCNESLSETPRLNLFGSGLLPSIERAQALHHGLFEGSPHG